MKREFNRVLVRFAQVSPIISAGLLVLNLSLTIGAQLKWRFEGGGYYGFLAFILLAVMAATAVITWVIADKLHLTHKDAALDMDKFSTVSFTPFEAVLWEQSHIPQLKALSALLENAGLHNEAADVRRVVKMTLEWVDKGYIPRSQYPERLLRYYPKGDVKEVGFRE